MVHILTQRARRPLILRHFGNFLNGSIIHKRSNKADHKCFLSHPTQLNTHIIMSNLHFIHVENRDSSVSTVIVIRAERFRDRFPAEKEISAFCKMFGPALQPTQLLLKGYLVLFTYREVRLTTSLHLVLRLRVTGVVPLVSLNALNAVVRDNFGCLFTHSFRLACVCFSHFLHRVLVPFLLLSFPIIIYFSKL